MNDKFVLKTQSIETHETNCDVVLEGTEFKFGYKEQDEIIFINSLLAL
jgi:hypothetical protein